MYDLCFLLIWIPASERVKKSKLRASGILRSVIPAKERVKKLANRLKSRPQRRPREGRDPR